MGEVVTASRSSRAPTPTDRLTPGPRLVAFWEGGSLTRGLRAGERIVLGRSRSADLSLNHPSVSRQHAVISLGAKVMVEDLGSHNGTRIGSVDLAPHTPVEWPSGTLLEVGRVLVMVEHIEAAANPLATEGQERWQHLDRILPMVARGSISVLLLGETGVGKEITAQSIHRLSPRAKGPFVTLHCAAVPDTLLEAELFGYERGAFTGATAAKPGLVEGAHGGTVFLDEVAEMPLATQIKLLRVVETKSVMRLGAVQGRPIDVRFVAATNRDVTSMVAEGTFRSDLYYRLAGVSLLVPPLRARRAEIMPLARTFLEQACAQSGERVPVIAPSATRKLESYAFPGNIRELKNVIECALLLCEGGPIEAHHLPPALGGLELTPEPEPRSLRHELESLERSRIEAALRESAGNRSQAARALGMPRRTLLERLRVYGLGKPAVKGTRGG